MRRMPKQLISPTHCDSWSGKGAAPRQRKSTTCVHLDSRCQIVSKAPSGMEATIDLRNMNKVNNSKRLGYSFGHLCNWWLPSLWAHKGMRHQPHTSRCKWWRLHLPSIWRELSETILQRTCHETPQTRSATIFNFTRESLGSKDRMYRASWRTG